MVERLIGRRYQAIEVPPERGVGSGVAEEEELKKEEKVEEAEDVGAAGGKRI
jgi:hypothetical protein